MTNRDLIESLFYEKISAFLAPDAEEENGRPLSPAQFSYLADAYCKLQKLEIDRNKEGLSGTTVVVAFPALP